MSTVASSSSDVLVVQMEGWLLKRGAGFKAGDEPETKKKQPLFKRATLLKGKAEKKRYFVLVTQAGELDGSPPRAELRYFTSKRGVDAPRKGCVVLDTTMRVELSGHSTLSLFTLGRTYILRPDKSAGEPSSALARVTAGKWVYALEFAINGLRAWDLGSRRLPQGVHAVTRFSALLSPEEIEARQDELLARMKAQQQRQQEQPQEQQQQQQQQQTQTNRSKLKASAETHAEMWDSFGLQAYNALVAHFGPALMDLQRLEDHLRVRTRISAKEVELFQGQAHLSQDVAVYEQQTTARMLMAVYKDMEDRATLVGRHLKRLEKEVLAPVKEMHAKLLSELDSIVSYYAGTTGNIERLYKGVYEMKQNVIELQVARDHAVMHARQRKTKVPGSKSLVALRSGVTLLRRKSSLRFRGGSTAAASTTVKNDDEDEDEEDEFPLDDEVAALTKEITATEEFMAQTKAALRKEEAKHAGRMKQALKSLHALEIERLNAQALALRRVAELEERVFRHAHKVFQPQAPLSVLVEQVDPAKDVEATSKRLLRALQ